MKMIATTTSADGRFFGGILVEANGTLRVCNSEHALRLLLDEHWLEQCPLLKELLQRGLQRELGAAQRLLPTVECEAVARLLLDLLDTPQLLLHSANLLLKLEWIHILPKPTEIVFATSSHLAPHVEVSGRRAQPLTYKPKRRYGFRTARSSIPIGSPTVRRVNGGCVSYRSGSCAAHVHAVRGAAAAVNVATAVLRRLAKAYRDSSACTSRWREAIGHCSRLRSAQLDALMPRVAVGVKHKRVRVFGQPELGATCTLDFLLERGRAIVKRRNQTRYTHRETVRLATQHMHSRIEQRK
mmetsp:Transcript_35335/g.58533  ORF Transcript_35335/g.58533 Transcript_35335/m.58533 type:complete len:298 (-) Transcript_35335:847-1740(-)